MIIGHKNIINELNNAIENNEVAHAYVFSGSDGIGKKLVAIDFISKLLSQNDSAHNAFGNGVHSDYKYIEPDEKGKIKIEVVRNIVSEISIKPIMGEYKVYIIDDADTMTTEAQNALLKTLEEPPVYAVIILITSKYNSLLNTIRSRCQRVEFNKLSKTDIEEYIDEQKIDILINKDLFYELVNGSIGNINTVVKNVEIIKVLEKFVNRIENLSVIDANKFAKYLYQNKENINNILDYFETIVYNMINDAKVAKYIECIEKAKTNIIRNINYEISIDNMLYSIREVNNV